MSLANKVTLSRLVLTIIYLFLLYNVTITGNLTDNSIIYIVVFALFLIIAILDIVDGFLARLYKEVSSLGRMLDPFVDKIFIISSYIIFSCYEITTDILPIWIVLLILFRELLIQGIRHYCEGHGIEFGSNVFGKQKMLFQSIVLGGLVLYISYFKKFIFYKSLLQTLVYLMLMVTILSAFIYISATIKILTTKSQS